MDNNLYKLEGRGDMQDEVIPTVCKLCGALLDYKGLGEYLCPDCGHVEYDSYGLIRNFLEKHPGANILQVEKSTGIPRQKITKMVADQRFKASDNSIRVD